jgi:hypothetical protein
MIVSTSASLLAQALAQDAAQSSARVAIDRFKDVVFTVFKVLKPSSQRDRQTLPKSCALQVKQNICIFLVMFR